ncbi:hypothetical protein N2384_01015 [Bacillus paralicheniformis]|uniref:hypothetical protein n=1 Tax=Bacillus paralicheniformis TaxID=1648923 RepID=UPI0021A8ED4F|nr:hypothetical protein [Bacillus paralicheniformis]UWS61905.1 hypothetical protein N2384_01015 [Bacillus paralicheniformis]
MAHVMVEGFLLGAYQRVTYKKDAKPIHCVEALTLAGEGLDEKAWNEGAVRGQAYAYGTSFARLSPPNYCLQDEGTGRSSQDVRAFSRVSLPLAF